MENNILEQIVCKPFAQISWKYSNREMSQADFAMLSKILTHVCADNEECLETFTRSNNVVSAKWACNHSSEFLLSRISLTDDPAYFCASDKQQFEAVYKCLFIAKHYKLVDIGFIYGDNGQVDYDYLHDEAFSYIKEHDYSGYTKHCDVAIGSWKKALHDAYIETGDVIKELYLPSDVIGDLNEFSEVNDFDFDQSIIFILRSYFNTESECKNDES